MSTNQHAPSLNSVLCTLTNLQDVQKTFVGGVSSRVTTSINSTNSSTASLLFSTGVSSYLSITAFMDSGSTGGSLYIYAGADSSYPLYMKCSFVGGECKVPLPTYIYNTAGWSVYGSSDGTNFIHIGYSHYNVEGAASTAIQDNTDTYLYGLSANSNYGTANNMWLENAGTSSKAWMLMKFDLSSLSGITSSISSVLSLRCKTVSGAGLEMRNVRISAMLTDWVEGQATWNIRKTGTAWTVPGAIGGNEVRSTNDWTGTIFPVVDQRTGFDITNLVNEWLGGTLTNNGLIVYTSYQASGQLCTWHTNDATSSSDRPILNVQY